MFMYLLTIVLILLSFHLSTRYNKYARMINKIPGLPPLPFVGNLLTVNCSGDKVWVRLRELFDEFYPTFKIWKFKDATVFVRHPDDVKIILACKTNINKGELAYDQIKYLGVNGLVVSNEPVWSHRRKILNQAFTPNLVNVYTETTRKRSESYVNDLKSEGKSCVKNITEEYLRFFMGSVCEATMGFDLDSAPGMEETYTNGFVEITKIFAYRICRPYIADWMMKFLSIGQRQASLWKLNVDFINTVIEERRRYHEGLKANVMNNYLDDVNSGAFDGNLKGKEKTLAVIDVLLVAEKNGLIDSYGVFEEVTTFILAGYETTGISMAFLLVLLAENKEAQDLARAEIREVLGNGETITIEHLKQMNYLDRCIKEALRLYPAAPHIGRTITQELQLTNNIRLPVGTEVIVGVYDLQRDPNYWPEPNKFDPDRFLPENIKGRHPFAYVPFSGGLRNCIGQKMASMNMKILLAHILNNFYLEPIDLSANFKIELNITLLVDEIRLKFIRIDH